jgi:hypothetical protein
MTEFLGAAPGERSASGGVYRAGYHEGGLIAQTDTPMLVHPPIAHVPKAMREAVIPDVPIRMVSMGLTLAEFVLSANPNVMTKPFQ